MMYVSPLVDSVVKPAKPLAKFADLFQSHRWMMWIFFDQREVLIREFPNFRLPSLIVVPEIGSREVHHNGMRPPDSNSASARRAGASSFSDNASASICRSY